MSHLEEPRRAAADALEGPDAPDRADARDPSDTAVPSEVAEASPGASPLIDWGRTARRLRRVVLGLAVVVSVGWVIIGITSDAGFELRVLGEMTGLALLVAIAAEIVIVGSVALTAMLRAGERGERLAGSDVSLLPPQVRRGRRDPRS